MMMRTSLVLFAICILGSLGLAQNVGEHVPREKPLSLTELVLHLDEDSSWDQAKTIRYELDMTDTTYLTVVDKMPEPIGGLGAIMAKVRYPEIAKRAGIQGKVFVEVFLNERGEVDRAVVKEGIGAGCDEAAITALKQIRFRPGTQKGKPVKVRIVIPIWFKLGDDSGVYLVKSVEGPLSTKEMESIFDLLGVQVARYSYELPYKHRIRWRVEKYVSGKIVDSARVARSSLPAGKHQPLLFVQTKDREITFKVRVGSGTIGFAPFEVKNTASTWASMPNARLSKNARTPLFVFAANAHSISGIHPDERIEDIVLKYELVLVFSAELEYD